MDEQVRKRLKDAYSQATEIRNYEYALKLCEEVLHDHPFLADALRTRARIFAYMGDLSPAIDDMSTVINQNTREPDDYFSRGRWYLDCGEPVKALDDFTKVIDLGAASNFHYYDESAHFFRAAALLQLDRFAEALSDCKAVRDDFLVYTKSGQLSKSEIMMKVTAGLASTPPQG